VTLDHRLLALCAVGALLGFAGCGEKQLNTAKVENLIKQGLESRNLALKGASVTCPKDRKVKKGDTFTCQLEGFKPSAGPTATVTQTDDKAHIKVEVRGLPPR
jgi:hypothetical protein